MITLFYSLLLYRIDKCVEEALSLLWYYALEKRIIRFGRKIKLCLVCSNIPADAC